MNTGTSTAATSLPHIPAIGTMTDHEASRARYLLDVVAQRIVNTARRGTVVASHAHSIEKLVTYVLDVQAAALMEPHLVLSQLADVDTDAAVRAARRDAAASMPEAAGLIVARPSRGSVYRLMHWDRIGADGTYASREDAASSIIEELRTIEDDAELVAAVVSLVATLTDDVDPTTTPASEEHADMEQYAAAQTDTDGAIVPAVPTRRDDLFEVEVYVSGHPRHYPVVLAIYPEQGHATIEKRREKGVTFDAINLIDVEVSLPVPAKPLLRDYAGFANDVAPLVGRVVAGHSTYWDDERTERVGVLTDDASRALDAIRVRARQIEYDAIDRV